MRIRIWIGSLTNGKVGRVGTDSGQKAPQKIQDGVPKSKEKFKISCSIEMNVIFGGLEASLEAGLAEFCKKIFFSKA